MFVQVQVVLFSYLCMIKEASPFLLFFPHIMFTRVSNRVGRAKGLVGGLGYSTPKQAHGLVGWVESEEGISFYILID